MPKPRQHQPQPGRIANAGPAYPGLGAALVDGATDARSQLQAFALDFQQLLAKYPKLQATLAVRVVGDPDGSQLNIVPGDGKLAKQMLTTILTELQQVNAEPDLADWATAWAAEPPTSRWRPQYRYSTSGPGPQMYSPPRPGETIDQWRDRVWGTHPHHPGRPPG